MYKLRVIEADGTITVLETEKQPNLPVLIELIGGWLEYHRALDGKAMLMDEEGRMKGLLPNPMATKLAGFLVVGTAIYFEGGEFS